MGLFVGFGRLLFGGFGGVFGLLASGLLKGILLMVTKPRRGREDTGVGLEDRGEFMVLLVYIF